MNHELENAKGGLLSAIEAALPGSSNGYNARLVFDAIECYVDARLKAAK